MNSLITINYENDSPTVSGRELHAALGVDTRYNDWFARMCEYGFSVGKDFYSNLSKSQNSVMGRPQTDHMLTIPMAKEICMLQRNEAGKKFREYFIAVEEAWNSPDKVIERAFGYVQQRALEAERKALMLTEENEDLKAALNISLQYCTVAKYNKDFGMGWSLKEAQEVGRRLTQYCYSRGIEIKKCQTNDERFSYTNSYPMSAWKDFMSNPGNYTKLLPTKTFTRMYSNDF